MPRSAELTVSGAVERAGPVIGRLFLPSPPSPPTHQDGGLLSLFKQPAGLAFIDLEQGKHVDVIFRLRRCSNQWTFSCRRRLHIDAFSSPFDIAVIGTTLSLTSLFVRLCCSGPGPSLAILPLCTPPILL